MTKSDLFSTRQGLQALLKGFLERASQEPAAGSLPLYIAGHRCGWLFPGAAKALSGHPNVLVETTSAHLGPNLTSGDTLDAFLAEIAQKLRAAGCTPGWRNELLDIWTQEDPRDQTSSRRVGAIERGVMRPLGLTTRAVHLSGWSEDGRLWVARRSLTKATDPGMWDTLVGGLVGNLEDPELALVRESDEEAGLDAPDIVNRTPLRAIAQMKRRIPEGFQTEIVLTCECVLPSHIIPSNRDGEVMEIKLLDTETLLDMLKNDAFTLEASIVITEDLWRRTAQ
jgi:isopentenyldiphosphate isomerase